MRHFHTPVSQGSHDEGEVNVHTNALHLWFTLQGFNHLGVATSAHLHQQVELSHQVLVKTLVSPLQWILEQKTML